MNKKLIYALIIFISLKLFSQDYNTSTFNNAINFDLIKSEISASYKLKSINFDGNRYYFEEPKKANLELFDGRKIKNLLTNYNLFDQVFEVINNENQKVKLLPNKISKVFFSDNSFISLNGKFYESIESNENFSLLADTFLEAYTPDYQPGFQEKPNLTFRTKNILFIFSSDKLVKFQRNKKSLLDLFSKSKSKEIKSFFKKNKFSPRDNNDLSKLFIEFYSDLII